MSYLKNVWYLAGWASELDQTSLLPRTILNQEVVLFRDQEGLPRALADRCPHRFAPLSRGQWVKGTIQCGYHGLRFDGEGHCAENPHGPVRASLCVQAYPLVERHRGLWVWMGDVQAADPSLIPDLGYLSAAPNSAFSCGYLRADVHFELFVDNLLDLSHTDYLHPTTLGGAGITGTRPKLTETDQYVEVEWFMANQPPPSLIRSVLPEVPDAVDSFQRMRWFAPAVMQLTVGTMAAGAHESEAMANYNAHILTPENERSSHYFFAATRNFRVEDRSLNDQIAATRAHIFATEDLPMLEAIQARMGDQTFWELDPQLLNIDSGSVRVRRRLAELIAAEAETTK